MLCTNDVYFICSLRFESVNFFKETINISVIEPKESVRLRVSFDLLLFYVLSTLIENYTLIGHINRLEIFKTRWNENDIRMYYVRIVTQLLRNSHNLFSLSYTTRKQSVNVCTKHVSILISTPI